MAIYRMPGGGENNLATAIQMWDHFFGPSAKRSASAEQRAAEEHAAQMDRTALEKENQIADQYSSGIDLAPFGGRPWAGLSPAEKAGVFAGYPGTNPDAVGPFFDKRLAESATRSHAAELSREAVDAGTRSRADQEFQNKAPGLFRPLHETWDLPITPPDGAAQDQPLFSRESMPQFEQLTPSQRSMFEDVGKSVGLQLGDLPQAYNRFFSAQTGKDQLPQGTSLKQVSVENGKRTSVAVDPTVETATTQRAALDRQIDLADKMATGFAATDEVKNYVRVSRAFDAMQEHLDASAQTPDKKGTGPDDIAMIFSFMKLVDPSSTVREGEFATAANAGGPFLHLWGLYNKARGEGFLTDGLRRQFVEAAGREVNTYVKAANASLDRTVARAAEYGIGPNLIAPSGHFPTIQPPQQAPEAAKGDGSKTNPMVVTDAGGLRNAAELATKTGQTVWVLDPRANKLRPVPPQTGASPGATSPPNTPQPPAPGAASAAASLPAVNSGIGSLSAPVAGDASVLSVPPATLSAAQQQAYRLLFGVGLKQGLSAPEARRHALLQIETDSRTPMTLSLPPQVRPPQ